MGVALDLVRALAHAASTRAFGAAKTTEAHTPPRNANFSPDGAVQDADIHLRAWGRHFEENFDLAVAVLDELVNQVVGAGIRIEPMVIDPATGVPLEALNESLSDLVDEWSLSPEVTEQITWGECQRLSLRAMFRDGEHFIHHVQGTDRGYDFRPGRIPYAIELVEADRIPLDLTTDQVLPALVQGIHIDAWHRPLGYEVLITHPGGNSLRFSPVASPGFAMKTRTVPAEQMTHLAWRRRFPQVRGVSVFAPVTRRLHDLNDYDQSERIAARVNSRIAMWIERDPEATSPAQVQGKEREITLPQGGVLDELLPGEKIGTASTDRPNAGLNDFRDGQLRAVAAGTYTRYSAIARNYNGTYSSQRQELVEAAHAYRPLTELFIARFVRPQYARLIETAILTGRVVLPNMPLDQLLRADYHGPAIPWIDPKKEAEADILLVENDLATRDQVIRKRGGDPRKVPRTIRDEPTKAPATPEPTPDSQRSLDF